MTWCERVVAELSDLKAQGYAFEDAKAEVQKRSRAEAPRVYETRRAQLFVVAGEDYEEESFEDCSWRYFEDAWFGRKPQLRGWAPEVLRDSAWDEPARHRGMVA